MKKSLSVIFAIIITFSCLSPALAEWSKGYDYGVDNYTVEQTLTAPDAQVVLLKRQGAHGFLDQSMREYELWLCWEDDYKQLILPSTVEVAGELGPLYPTDRAPDAMEVNWSEKALTYLYSFDEPLFNISGEMLHDKGDYLYTVDISTGDLSVKYTEATSSALPEGGFTDVSPTDWFAPYVDVCVEAGLMKGTGAGQFSPNSFVTRAEAMTIAARLHHILNGGDGNLPAPPEGWGLMTVEFENGTVLHFDSDAYRLYPIPMSSVLGAVVSQEQMKTLDWFGREDFVRAKISAEFADGTAGPWPCLVYWNSWGGEGQGHMRFKREYETGTEEEQEGFDRLMGKLTSLKRPSMKGWFRNTVHYLETVGLGGSSFNYFEAALSDANRMEYVRYLDAVAKDILNEDTYLNDISDFPDSTKHMDTEAVLRFYNAGILTGKDEYGTFAPEHTLTRAECAAMASRILKPELRLKFQPTPTPEKYRYELTYLMDDPMESHEVTHPVLPLVDGSKDYGGILTLDGEIIPWPYGEKPTSMRLNGGYSMFFMSFWETQADGRKVEVGGVMDEWGTFVVPLTAGCYSGWPLDDGRYITLGGTLGGTAILWNRDGNTTDLGVMHFADLRAQYPNTYTCKKGLGLDVDTFRTCYVDGGKHPVSEDFDWVGRLTPSGRGFVGREGKIYRIEFFEK